MDTYKKNAALILVDIQNDFCPGGSLPVKDGDKVVKPANAMVKKARENDWITLATGDWHPAVGSVHFAENGGKWPRHCVQNTLGAQFHPDLDLDGVLVFHKGIKPDEQGYSVWDGGVAEDGRTVEQVLAKENIRRLYVCGLATDYCVEATVMGGLERDYKVYLLVDAIRAVNAKKFDGYDAIRKMRRAGATLIMSKELLND